MRKYAWNSICLKNHTPYPILKKVKEIFIYRECPIERSTYQRQSSDERERTLTDRKIDRFGDKLQCTLWESGNKLYSRSCAVFSLSPRFPE